MFEVAEASIAELRAVLESGETTAVGLVDAYLARIAAFDGPRGLNAMVVMNPAARVEAEDSDARRARGELRGPLDGIPYTAKDSYLANGLTAAAGSPAFEHLVAHRDAFAIERLRAGGAILLGLTNMPPMANGGMQRGVYGRAESPYNREYLTAAFASGSSNGSGSATAASFAAFGLAEETWSSGRAPASNNALCAYTPSRGVISVRGNWPLIPTMDVVVPHTRSMADLLEVLDVIVADDLDPEAGHRGDFWRLQPWIEIPLASEVRPPSYTVLDPLPLAGLRFGIPGMYLNADPLAGTAEGPGIGGPTGQRIETRASVVVLWEALRVELEAAGASIEVVDFPVVSNYEGDRPGAPTVFSRGIIPASFFDAELWDLAMWGWDDFLAANGDPALRRLADVDGPRIFPAPPGALPDRYTGFDLDLAEYVTRARDRGVTPLDEIEHLAEGIRGLDETRQVDLEDWMQRLALDAIVFPAVADVGRADMDVDLESADAGWRNGVWVANGNLAIRHLGIPTVTIPLGTMSDTRMPVGLTILGPAYADTALLRIAYAIESLGPRRTPPPLARRSPAASPPLARRPGKTVSTPPAR